MNGISFSAKYPIITSKSPRVKLESQSRLARLDADIVAFKTDIYKIKKDLNLKPQQELKLKDAKKVFEYFGIEAQKTSDKKLIISEYKQPKSTIKYSDCGINENELLKHVVEIKGDAHFENSKITNLGAVKSIGGYADFRGIRNIDLSNLEYIGNKAICDNKELAEKLEQITQEISFW